MGNGISLIIIGGYLIGVVANGNGEKLLTEFKNDLGFIPFFVSFFTLYYIAKNKSLGNIGNELLFLAILGLLLTKGGIIFKAINDFLNTK